MPASTPSGPAPSGPAPSGPNSAGPGTSARPGDRLDRVLARAAAVLADVGVESPRLDARLLLGAAAGLTPGQLLACPEQPIDAAAAARFAELLARRQAREPVSRILALREFWSLDFALGPATLDPRPQSETLIEAVLARLEHRAAPRAVLDLGTGSGCLLLALISELPGAWGLGVDLDPVALGVARLNAAALGLGARACFLAADWGAALVGRWDVILCNPPYVEAAEIGRLAPEVAAFDPWLALDGGADGLAAYRRVVPHIGRLLTPGGLTALEVGADQAPAVTAMVRQSGLHPLDQPCDLAGVVRCVLAGHRPEERPIATAEKGDEKKGVGIAGDSDYLKR